MPKSKNKISNQDFYDMGIRDVALIRQLGRLASKFKKVYSKDESLKLIKEIIDDPVRFTGQHGKMNEIAMMLLNSGIKGKSRPQKVSETGLLKKPLEYKIFGHENIDSETLEQMRTAMCLPVIIKGALMPDAHVGYGIPIGGVLATRRNIVIPYAVGVDIACRMCLSVYDLPCEAIYDEENKLKKAITDCTIFGVGGENKKHFDTSVFDKPEWKATETIRSLKPKAYSQYGTSGAGNHFVEWGVLDIIADDDLLDLKPGRYLSLLSHSGSRNFGSSICDTYFDIAKQKTILPREARHLAWLDLDTDEGQEYWIAMNLAGEYASANHHEIHAKIARAMNINTIRMIENHHNFAWKDTIEDGTEVIIHRKGATPAGLNNIGIIPGSMTQHGFIVRGKADSSSLKSASHGAGRQLSRTQAMKSIDRDYLEKYLQDKGVVLTGGDTDEAPMAYKDIDQVMKSQEKLVEIIARFSPKIVRMADPERHRRKR
jgi:tRNA-splicing ligase RtcB